VRSGASEVEESEEPAALGVDRLDLDLLADLGDADLRQAQRLLGAAALGFLDCAELEVGPVPGAGIE
jgi:hypothetical protein